MTKQKTTTPKYVTKEILKKELGATEKRLDAKIDKLDVKIDNVEKRLDAKIDGVEQRVVQLDTKIDSTAHSFKEYVDVRISQVQKQMDQRFDQVDQRFGQVDNRFDKLEKKLDTNAAGLVDLIERRIGEIITIGERIENHEKRIGVLEAKE